MADHAIADHDQRLQLVQGSNVGIHRKHPTKAHHGFLKAKKRRLKPCGSRRLCLFCAVSIRRLRPDLP
jgi:hypothetical protein